MRDLPLNMLRALAAVHESGGVRPAGRRLGVTHSAVSRHLRELEAWLQTPLLDRQQSTREVVFTPAGEALAQAALDTLRDLEAAVGRVREARRPNAVVIATTPSFAVRWLLPRLPHLQAARRTIEVSVVVDQRPQTPRDEGADLSIRMGPSGEITSDMDSEAMMDDALYPVMSPAYWRRAGKPTQAGDLAGLRLLHDRDPNASWATWKKAFGPAHLDVRRGARLTSSDLVLRGAEQGLGVALARGRLAADAIDRGSLVRPLGDMEVGLGDAYRLLFDGTARARPQVRAVADWLLREASLQRSP